MLTGVKVETDDYSSSEYLNEIYSKSDFIPNVAREEYDIKLFTTNKYVIRLRNEFVSNYTRDYFCKLDFMKTVSQMSECVRYCSAPFAIKKIYQYDEDNFIVLPNDTNLYITGTDSQFYQKLLLSVFALAVFRIMQSISKLLAYLNAIVFNKSSIEALYNDMKSLDEELRQQSNEKKDAVLATDYQFNREISFQNIYFKYQNTDRYVLENAQIAIPKNKSIALIGSSGVGKTTLDDIVLGILPVEKGSIAIDGKILPCSSINLNGKKTMIIIAHRRTTIKNCDYIYEVKNKKVSLVEE